MDDPTAAGDGGTSLYRSVADAAGDCIFAYRLRWASEPATLLVELAVTAACAHFCVTAVLSLTSKAFAEPPRDRSRRASTLPPSEHEHHLMARPGAADLSAGLAALVHTKGGAAAAAPGDDIELITLALLADEGQFRPCVPLPAGDAAHCDGDHLLATSEAPAASVSDVSGVRAVAGEATLSVERSAATAEELTALAELEALLEVAGLAGGEEQPSVAAASYAAFGGRDKCLMRFLRAHAFADVRRSFEQLEVCVGARVLTLCGCMLTCVADR